MVAHDLRRLPLAPDTKRLHLHALELKRDLAGWRRNGAPDMATRLQLLDQVEALAQAVRRHFKTSAG